jgi:hypothetical protein
VAAGAFRSANPEWAFRMIYHAADGLLDDLIADGAPIDAEAISRSVLDMAHRTLGHPGLAPADR